MGLFLAFTEFTSRIRKIPSPFLAVERGHTRKTGLSIPIS